MNCFLRTIALVVTFSFAPLTQAQTYSDSERLEPRLGSVTGLGIEMRFGPSFTTDDFGGQDIDDGLSFQVLGTYQLARNFGIYVGANIDAFDANRNFTGRDNAISDIGYALGLTLSGDFGRSRVGWRVRGGANYGETKLYEEDNNSHIGATGHELGWEVGAAVTIDLKNKWILTPGITYRARSATLRFAGSDREVDLNTVTVGMGIARVF